ncbi:ATP-binding cassette subfamily B protein [Paenibacillus cellulosilyticus]|uniref:ATP-binding cassette subfamily B protein n=1 Tax=Paenibacillus cellulosilyticus TaxID=375489 RepID=A0A2V2YNV3_9BACL|nr:ABC transporter ATP-binding protein [Paenibacillus cellulosilyticus]PWV94380.1 ATP-binding cassette subfamily B protein [Paenibacillus cellulosilyticus]QKS43885.1 ABC transporter ATP-binding protein [Paenibacillus cellulosilyticus]
MSDPKPTQTPIIAKPSSGDNSGNRPANRTAAFRALLSYAKPHRWMFAAVFGSALLAISADLLQPYLVKIAIDDELLTGEHEMRKLIILGAVYLLMAVVSFAFGYLQSVLVQRIGQSIVARLREDLFRHITNQSMSFFDRHPIGSLVTNESSDTETISQFFTQVLISLVRDGLMLILVVAFMFSLDARLAAFCLLLFPVIIGIAIAFRRALRQSYQRARSQLSRVIAFVAENLSGMSLTQAFRQEQEQRRRFAEKNSNYLRESLREIRTSVMFNRTYDTLGNIAVALVVWLGGLAVLDNAIAFGVLYAFINYIRQFFQPINQMTQQWNTLQSTFVSVERLWRIFSQEPEVKEPSADEAVRPAPAAVRGAIDFNGVSFAYIEGRDVLRELDLHIQPGEFIGIVGTTGAGKSSLVNLLARFYDVRAGNIMIDGIDVKRMPQDDLHRIVGLVQQEPFLYSGSIIDNVRLFREEITREQAIEACRLVGAHAMIMRLKDGYDTRLSERGSGLSAGERQLLSFARIVVHQPRILILDEATANLDSHTERLIQQALHVVSEGRTTLVIAHRLSTIQHADRIIVMRNGLIEEQGTHATLLEDRGYYAELYAHSRRGGTLSHAEGRLSV